MPTNPTTIRLRHAPADEATVSDCLDEVLSNIDGEANPAQVAAMRGVIEGLMVIEHIRREMSDNGVEYEAFVAILASHAAGAVVELLTGPAVPLTADDPDDDDGFSSRDAHT